MTDESRDSGIAPDGGDAGAFATQDAPATVPAPEPVEASTAKSGTLRWIVETIAMVALAFILAQGIKTYVLQPFVVPTGSMEATIMTGDRVLSEKVSLYFGDPEPGDIVVFDDPQGQHPQLIKRVIAVAGQTVSIEGGSVYVDGVALEEPYINGVETEPGSEPLPVTIGEGQVWLMGDNRPNSGDSRYLGAQPVEAVNARAFAIYWPLDRIGWLD
jgi:signal peptidase I